MRLVQEVSICFLGKFVTNVRTQEITFVLSFISLSFVSTSKAMIDFIITLILASVGISGNILILFILLQKHMQNTFNKLRAALAVFDSMVLGVMLLSQFILMLNKDLHGKVTCYFSWPVWQFSKTASMFMTVAIAIERLIAITYPHKYSTNQHYRATKYVISVTITAMAFNLSKFNEYQPDASGNDYWSKKWGITPTSMHKNSGYAIYDVIIYKLLVASLIPITLLICSYAKIFAKLRQNRKITEMSGNGNSHKDRKTAKDENMARLFAGVVITSLICNIPEIIVYIILHIQRSFDTNEPPQWVDITLMVRDIFIAINSSVNIIIYSLLSKPFREECKMAATRMIRKCKCHENVSPPASSSTNNQSLSAEKSKQLSEACTSTSTTRV